MSRWTSHRTSRFFTRRWLIVYSGFLVQLAVGMLVGLSFGQPGHPALTLAPIPGQGGLCRVAQIQPFTEAWLFGMQAGDVVRVSSTGASARVCLAPDVVVQVPTTPLEPTLAANVALPPLEVPQLALEGILALLLNLLGSAILLRAVHRPVARVAYGLFACTSLLFCLLSIQWTNILWSSLLLFILGTLVPGLAATFVCLFPARKAAHVAGRDRHAGSPAAAAHLEPPPAWQRAPDGAGGGRFAAAAHGRAAPDRWLRGLSPPA
jgi:hypothetical protein